MPWPRHCHYCHAADVFDFRSRPLSYAAVLLGHDAASLRALRERLEAHPRGGVTDWCPCCQRFGVLLFPLLAAHGDTPPSPAAAEHLLALAELATLLDAAVPPEP
jgi:hypothetical protein